MMMMMRVVAVVVRVVVVGRRGGEMGGWGRRARARKRIVAVTAAVEVEVIAAMEAAAVAAAEAVAEAVVMVAATAIAIVAEPLATGPDLIIVSARQRDEQCEHHQVRALKDADQSHVTIESSNL